MEIESHYDIIIVGGGPNGLNAYRSLSIEFPEKNIILLEKGKLLESINQFPDVLWHSKMSELKLPLSLNTHFDDDYNPITSELIRYYELFAKSINANVATGCEVIEINADEFGDIVIKVRRSKDNDVLELSCNYLILATGIFGNKRKLDLESKMVKYNFNSLVHSKHLALVGAGNSAIDFITYLLPYNKISWIFRSDTWSPPFSVVDENFRNVLNKYRQNLTIYNNEKVKDFNNGVVTLSSGQKILGVNDLTAMIGYNSLDRLYIKSGFGIDGECLELDEDYQTTKKNVFAFGAIMARNVDGVAEPTFIHNGNIIKLNKIISKIKRNEILNILGENSSYYSKKQIPKRVNVIRRLIRKLSRGLGKIIL